MLFWAIFKYSLFAFSQLSILILGQFIVKKNILFSKVTIKYNRKKVSKNCLKNFKNNLLKIYLLTGPFQSAGWNRPNKRFCTATHIKLQGVKKYVKLKNFDSLIFNLRKYAYPRDHCKHCFHLNTSVKKPLLKMFRN